MGFKKLVVLGLCVIGGWHYHQSRTPHLAPGVGVAEAPRQTDTDARTFSFGNYTITPLADFDIRARILSRKDYSTDKEADLSPIDLTLGWGRMSDVEVYSQIDISQGGRFANWSTDSEPPIPTSEINRSASNMHLIPANSQVEIKLRKTRPGQIIRLRGYLVQAHDSSGWTWRSSTSRTDAGAGACEVIWVESVDFEDPTQATS